MTLYLLIVSLVIITCVVFNKLSHKIGIPVLLAFILLGMLFGSDGIFKIPFENYAFAEKICSLALIFIMFYGGFGTRWSEAKPVAAKAVTLSTLGVFITAGLTGSFCWLILKFDFLESMLIGSVISSTDAASVFSILRSKKLGLKDNTASMLEMESGSNDPCSYMLTIIILTCMESKISAGSVIYMIFAQFGYGLLIGIIIALGASFILKNIRFSTPGFDTIFVLASAILSYALPTLISGNGYLSAYIVGIILGNSNIKNKQELVHFFDGLTGLMQMLIFFLLGLLSFPSKLPSVLLPSIAIVIFLTFIARPLSVFSILSPFKCNIKQQLLVSWSGLRGAASIVFAIMATVNPAVLKNDIFHIVFCIVLISIAFQGTLIPFMSRKLNMIDKNTNVLKTFNDYTEELNIGFIKLTITEEHPWNGSEIKDLELPPEVLIILIERDNQRIVPNGYTKIIKDDIAVISAPSYENEINTMFLEYKINPGSKWEGKKTVDFYHDSEKLIVLIKRNDGVIIPQGQTEILKNDVLVIHAPEEDL